MVFPGHIGFGKPPTCMRRQDAIWEREGGSWIGWDEKAVSDFQLQAEKNTIYKYTIWKIL